MGKDAGKLRAIGVSNFDVGNLTEILQVNRTPVSLNQCEMNLKSWDRRTLEFCQEHGIAYEAYSPLGKGDVLNDPTVLRVASAQNRSAASVALRWVVQKGAL